MGLFGDPADPETNALVVKMLQLPETGEILEHLARQAEKQQMQQQQMMEMQQQQMMAQQQQPQGQQYDPEAEGHRAELDMQKQTTLAEQKAQMEQAKMQMQSQQKQEEYAAQKIADINHAMAMQAVSPEPTQSSTSGGKQKPRPANKK
jgi:septal ring factor EnvC (AmiA/AmiB activator)